MENISPADIEICILTFNRATLLESSLSSVMAQTARGFAVTVYDNASSDNTPQVVGKFASARDDAEFKYVRHSFNMGPDANFHAALDGAKRKYVMMFHDDDILNRRYIEFAVEAMNKFGDVALLASNYTYRRVDENFTPDAPVERKAFVFENQEDFAAYIFCAGRASYSSAIYRTADLRKFNRKNIYGKIGDTPVMIDASKGGKTVVLADRNLFVYRIHGGQDSKNVSNGPFREEIINRDMLFRNILMHGTFAHRFAFKISYAEWLATHIKFAGATEETKRAFLRSLSKDECGGIMTMLYSLRGFGELFRGLVRILLTARKIVWKSVPF